MAPRKRIHKGLEVNLYSNKVGGTVYYRYKHPITGKFHGVGSDKAKANAAARILNAKLVQGDSYIVDQVMGINEKDMDHLISRFRTEQLPDKKLAAGSLKAYNYRLDRISRDIGNTFIRAHSVETIAEYLDKNFEKSPYVKHRTTLGELFRFAMLKGLRGDNPVLTTYAKADVPKERKRMTLDQYKALYRIAPTSIQIAMELALITLQGRNEICNLKYSDEKDGGLFIVRKKSQSHEWSHLRIEVTPQIAEIIRRSREDKIASPYIVHYRPQRIKESKETNHWSQYPLNKFSADFRELRDKSGIFDHLPKAQRPTFHEIRSLGSWLYEKAGFNTDYVQQLMAHGDEKMTEYYQSGHEKKWVQVRAELNLKEVLS